MLRHTYIILCACAWATTAHAQAYCIDSTAVGTLGVSVDALAFFKDNEFDGDVVRGYSLPGFRMQPRLTYTPLREVHLEAGLHATVFEGANKYPSYAFHDIAHWKGNQYQHGAHVLPFFRAVAQFGPDIHGRQYDADTKGGQCDSSIHGSQDDPDACSGKSRRSRTTIVLGDIYGGAAHGISQPLYNPELTLTDDPEAGAQVLVDRKRWHSDVWINWQSYIYEEDTHQEAFTVGWTQRVDLWQHRAHRLSLPVQIMAQHRGGEQDLPELNLGVQTIANGAAGLAYEWRRPTAEVAIANRQRRGVRSVKCEALALAAYQQSGHLWPFDFGSALWTSASVDWAFGLSVKAGLFHAPKQFCSLYGSPFFGTMSLKNEGMTFDGMTTGYWGVQYGKTFTVGSHFHHGRSHRGSYTIGAKADGYINHSRAPFSFGVFFSASPSFVLKRFK